MYSFFASTQTEQNAHGQSVTTLWRTIRANKEDRVAKLEWAPNGGLGRAVIGKVALAYDRVSRGTDPLTPEHVADV